MITDPCREFKARDMEQELQFAGSQEHCDECGFHKDWHRNEQQKFEEASSEERLQEVPQEL